jgi:hypothetical protein
VGQAKSNFRIVLAYQDSHNCLFYGGPNKGSYHSKIGGAVTTASTVDCAGFADLSIIGVESILLERRKAAENGPGSQALSVVDPW